MDKAAEQQLAILETFVLRARRIEAHSLAQDRQALTRLAQGGITVHFTTTAHPRASQSFPPEEQLESAAARVRPVLLQGESTYWSKVVKALGYFAKDVPPFALKVNELKSYWLAATEQTATPRSWIQVSDEEGNLTQPASDIQLAYAYIYGDVIHHDEERLRSVEGFDIDHRYQQAAVEVARVMERTIATLMLIRFAQRTGDLALNAAVFDQPVVATLFDIEHEVELWQGQPGAQMPPAGGPPGEGWKQFKYEDVVTNSEQ